MTGGVFNNLTEIRDVQAAVEQIHKEYLARPTAAPAEIEAAAPQPVALSDEALLAKMMQNGANGEKFRRLWEGDTSQHNGDDSAADLALCNYLAFWTGRDAQRMDDLFRSSGLMRPKWDEQRGATTYGAITVERACQDCRNVYDPQQTTAADAFGAGGWPVGFLV